MIGEISIGGVFFPPLLLFGLLALGVTGVLSRLFQIIGVYRFVAYRPLVDLALFILLLGLAVLLTAHHGLQS
ncbi:DUF1656 domain-containing protein [Sphingomonas oryzagri]|jgi:hypothetical protein|uniref:DUF1656 domain-containing protein n=1 Tax=Sphingomonas oryzagri TaxID=3042314 RepID=A0ABT6N670_9SPHN|nr:DUF1656 domain-containing protein [Sphingomonas oryzagri]MDH7640619.1 DUF1656 domain-containing protein [Sphingomonas oryzagri]